VRLCYNSASHVHLVRSPLLAYKAPLVPGTESVPEIGRQTLLVEAIGGAIGSIHCIQRRSFQIRTNDDMWGANPASQ
jgi:hypothetical protein